MKYLNCLIISIIIFITLLYAYEFIVYNDKDYESLASATIYTDPVKIDDDISYDTQADSCDIKIGWYAIVNVTAVGGSPLENVTITCTDNLSNEYGGITNASGQAIIALPEYKKWADNGSV